MSFQISADKHILTINDNRYLIKDMTGWEFRDNGATLTFLFHNSKHNFTLTRDEQNPEMFVNIIDEIDGKSLREAASLMGLKSKCVEV